MRELAQVGSPDAAGALNPALARLDRAREDLARRWLARVVETSSLAEVGQLETGRSVRELPELLSDVLRRSDRNAGGAPAGAAGEQRSAARLAGLRAQEPADPAQLVRDVSTLQAVLLSALAETPVNGDAGSVLEAADRLSESLGGALATAVEDLVAARSREFESMANTDALTGIYNVRFMHQHVSHLVGVQRRYGHPFAVLLFDIDGLKRINDAFGHAVGDRALVGMAQVLRTSLRSIDTPVRMGGDEFCVLAPHQTTAGGRILGERIRHGAERIEGPWGQALGVSVGVVSCPEHAVEPGVLFELADEAMYRSKASGGAVAVSAGRLTSESGNGVSSRNG